MGYPAELTPIFEKFITCEYASLTKTGAPITMPVTPYVGAGGTLDISTGLVYPAKAERARRDQRVALLYSHPYGSGLDAPHTVLVIGDASVRDRDLQANADRYARDSMRKLPDMMSGFPEVVIKGQRWYFARIWVEVTPLKVMWWAHGDLDRTPECWTAPPGTSAPPSDPPPHGESLKAWKTAPVDWRVGAQQAIRVMGLPVLTLIGDDGYPYPMRVKQVDLTADGFTLELPAGMPIGRAKERAACLTFHRHNERFDGQQNMLFAGQVESALDDLRRVTFRVERRVVDWSGGGGGALSKLFAAVSFLHAGVRLTPRLKREAERRGQPVPKVNLP